MKAISIILFCICAFIVFYAMIGYPLFLKLVNNIIKPGENRKDYHYEPTVSYMIVAHNEAAVIKKKLENAIGLDYPVDKFQIIVASDNSTDNTNKIVCEFIDNHKDKNIVLCCSKEHKGKTNAQNEAQKISTGEILVMTDANTMLSRNAIKELVSYFVDSDVAYVCGKLEYSNNEDNLTSNSESTYWDLDLFMRDVESRIKTITAGNGALYAVRNNEYIDFEPIYCHDSIMPFTYGKQGKRALFNPRAVAYEKAGETNEDEYKRKVRMNRDILDMLLWGIKVINPIKYGWMSYFFFGHRTCRYLLWISHLIIFVISTVWMLTGSIIGIVLFIGQSICFFLSWLSIKGKYQSRIPLFRFACYYGMTVIAQLHGVINIITGHAKPVWEKAESTR